MPDRIILAPPKAFTCSIFKNSSGIAKAFVSGQLLTKIFDREDEDPNLPVSLEIKDLAYTFSNLYVFHVEECLIPAYDLHNSLQAKIHQFLGQSDPRQLKIVYYAGHGKLTNNGQPAWTR